MLTGKEIEMVYVKMIAFGILLLIGFYEWTSLKYYRPKPLLLPLYDAISTKTSSAPKSPPKTLPEWLVWCEKDVEGEIIRNKAGKPIRCDY